MFILPRIYEALIDAGVQLVDNGDGTVDLIATSAGALPVLVEVKASSRTIGPSDVAQLLSRHPNQHVMLIAPKFSDASREAINAAGWSWIASADGVPITGSLNLPGQPPLAIHPPADLTQQPTRHRPKQGRRPYQRVAIIRHLLLRDTWTQRQLAEVCAVSQPRTSQVLSRLEHEGLVSRHGARGHGPFQWRVTNFDKLLSDWIESYPGPGGLAPTYWYGLDRLSEQTRKALDAIPPIPTSFDHWHEPGWSNPRGHEHASSAHGGDQHGFEEHGFEEPGLKEHRPGPASPNYRASRAMRQPVVSGDAAADLIAPYRRGQVAVIYSPVGVDLTAAGLTPSARQDATLKLVVPEDESIFPHPVDNLAAKLAPQAPYRLADPVQVMWDLLDDDRTDADQAADAVKRSFAKVRKAR